MSFCGIQGLENEENNAKKIIREKKIKFIYQGIRKKTQCKINKKEITLKKEYCQDSKEEVKKTLTRLTRKAEDMRESLIPGMRKPKKRKKTVVMVITMCVVSGADALNGISYIYLCNPFTYMDTQCRLKI